MTEISEEVCDLINDIRNHADSMCPVESDLATDKWLGQLEALIYNARQSISDNWPKHIRTVKGEKPFISPLDLEELGL